MRLYPGGGQAASAQEALQRLRLSAAAGDADAQVLLAASLFEGGDGVEKNWIEAREWASAAAGQGDARGEYILARLYIKSGLAFDPSDPVWMLLWSSAAKGIADAQLLYGLFLFSYDTQKSASKVVYWWRKAAEQGNAHAQFKLGQAYWEGYGVKRDREEGANWIEKAFDGGSPQAKALFNKLKI